MNRPYLRPSQDGSTVTLQVRAQPGAKKTEIVGVHGDSLKIKVNKPPLEGAANDELLRFLATFFELPRSKVTLIRGDKSKDKVFRLDLKAESVQFKLKDF